MFILKSYACYLACGAFLFVVSDRIFAGDPTFVSKHGSSEYSIDHFVSAKYVESGEKPASACDKSTFVRRLYLDLVGRIPTLEERDQYLEDDSSSAKQSLVDQLLSSDEHAKYMAKVFDTILMGRNERKLGQRAGNGWIQYLEDVFAESRPWNQVAREVLLARPKESQRGHLWYLFEREDKHQDIAEAVARGFFGVDIACAQCHDHPLAIEIGQQHYWGLVAFFKRSKNEKSDAGIRLSESAVGGFDRYANALDGSSSEAALTFLDRQPVEETRPDDPAKQEDSEDLYLISEGGVKTPKFSRREKFVDEILDDHPRLSLALVNRVWALMIGRGLVHPVDEMDSMHPASHPELLKWLAEDFVSNGYDIRRVFRMIALSEVYELRSAQMLESGNPLDPSMLLVANIKPLTAEQMLDSIRVALELREEDLREIARDVRREFPEVIPENDSSSLQQALYLSNDANLNRLVNDAANRLAKVDAAQAEEDLVADQNISIDLSNPTAQPNDQTQIINRLYLRIFGREPEQDERQVVTQFLHEQQANENAIGDVVWAMITSAEFRFNH